MFQSGDYGLRTFNVFDFRPYSDDDKLENLWANSSLEGADDREPVRGA